MPICVDRHGTDQHVTDDSRTATLIGSRQISTHMLTSDSHQIPRLDTSQSFSITPLNHRAQELTSLREAERVKHARGVQSGIGDFGERGELGADLGDMSVG